MHRSYRGPDDLRRMQELIRRIWSPATCWHIGDLAWQRFQHVGREAEWPTALWESEGEVVAWGWTHLPGELSLAVDPAHPELAAEVLAWFEDVATAEPTVTILDAETHLIAALEERGYTRHDDPPFSSCHSRSLADLPAPELPDGFVARPVREGDLARRVEVHREVWAPSRLTEESYENVMRAWPYRASLDWIVEAPDGRFAAQCLIWLDELNAVGELEPVGTLSDFRRLGLGRAVCLAALHALLEAGGRQAVVFPTVGHPKSVGAVPLYEALGFRAYARTLTYRP